MYLIYKVSLKLEFYISRGSLVRKTKTNSRRFNNIFCSVIRVILYIQ